MQIQHYMPPSHGATSELNQALVDLTTQLEASHKRKEMLESELRSKKDSIWSADVAELGLEELETVKATLERVRVELEANKDRLMLEAGIFPNGYGYGDGFGYGFENYGYGLVDQKINSMMLSAAPMNMAMPPEGLLPALPDLSYHDHGFFLLPQ
jgi:hypothetical protein